MVEMKHSNVAWQERRSALIVPRVNVISPSHIDTPIMESLRQGDALIRMKEEFAKAAPLGRMGDSDEIAKAVSFLASDEASYFSSLVSFQLAVKLQVSLLDICNRLGYAGSCQHSKGAMQ